MDSRWIDDRGPTPIVFISGTLVNLVVLDEDLARYSDWAAWFNDEETTSWTQHHRFPLSRDAQVDFVKDLAKDASRLQLGIWSTELNALVGVISLNSISCVNRTAEFAVVIGDSRARKLHVWLEASRLILLHGRESLNVRRVYGGSFSKEVADLHVRLLGFSMEGLRPQHVFKAGAYHDVFEFGLFLDDLPG